MKKWYKWPQGYYEGHVPWYKVLRRLIGLPFIFFGVIVIYIGVTLGYGVVEAKATVNRIF